MAGLTDEPTMPQPKNEWLTTDQVVVQYHIDPENKLYDGKLKSMLYPTKTSNGVPVHIRCWLKDSIEAVLS